MKFRALHLFCGIGGGALGFQMAREEWKGTVGRIETLAGIDVDPEACADFEAITGAPAVQMDLVFKGAVPGLSRDRASARVEGGLTL